MDTIDSDSELSDDSSGSASTSTSSSSCSSQYEDTTEFAKITNHVLSLPKGLCENSEIFREFFSMETWKLVPDNFQAYLKNKFLPHFPENNEAQQEKTLQMLFNNDISRFGTSPLESLQKNLEEGNYRPDVLKLRESITKSRKIEQQFRECERVGNLAKSLMISRERLLRVAYNAPPGSIPKIDRLVNSVPILDGSTAAVRAKKRFYNEITHLSNQLGLSDCSDDELKEIDEHFPENKMLKDQLEDRKPTPNNETKIIGTMVRQSRLNGANNSLMYNSPTMLNDKFLKKILLEHKKRKLEEPDRPEFETNDIRITDVHNRAEISGGSFRKLLLAPKVRKPYTKNSNKYQTQQEEQEQQSITQLQYNNDSVLISQQQIQQQQSLLNNSYLKDKKQISSFSAAFAASIQPTIHHHLQSLNDNNSETGESEEEVNVETIGSPKRQLLHLPRIDESTIIDNTILGKNKTITLSKSMKKPVINYNGMNEDMLNENHENRITSENCQLLYNQQTHQQHVLQQINQQNIINKPVTIDDLDDIDMMHLPVELDDSLTVQQNISIMSDLKEQPQISVTPITSSQKLEKPKNTYTAPELMQETHACFLSLIRDIFCATPNHRMKLDELKSKIYNWLSNPITALNDWYNQADNWLILIPSAIHFLSGEFIDQPDEFVPYIEFKPQQNIYQWIGAGRDSDSHLLQLCQYWLLRKNEMGSKPTQKLDIRNNIEGKNRSFELEDSLLTEKPLSPPPPRCPTSWTVQVANPEEIEEFRIQERQRFENPHKAFTYRMYGFESVVGPVKGVYTQILALTKARGHTMLTADRPNFVTILTLVRDATARLPNGEGTRADICELLKCSQYISPQAAETVLQTIVSGALDRMHVEHDPCVRYDPKRKIWIYLHRNRSEDEFEKLHQQFQGITKNQKKPLSRKLKHKGQKVSENSLLIQNNATIQQQQQQMLSPITNQSQIIQQQQQIKVSTIQNPPIPQQLPALSSLSNNNNNSSNIQQPQKQSSSLISNQSNIGIVSPIKIATNQQQQQQKIVNILKPELVPIKQQNQQQLQSPILFDKSQNLDIVENIDLNIEPPQFILQKPINYQQKLNIVAAGTGKKITNLHLQNIQNAAGASVGVVVGSNNSTNQQQIRVSTPSGIQTIHVTGNNSVISAATSPLSNCNQDLQKQIQSNLPSQLLAGGTQQTPTIATSINPQQIVITGNKKMIVTSGTTTTSTTTKPILIQNQQTGGQQLVTQIRSNNNNNQQGYIIPLSSDQLQAISSIPGSQTIIASNLSPKFIKNNNNQQQQPPGLTTTINNRPTLLQQSNINNKNFVRVATTTAQAGKSLISPHVAATNITLQQQKLLSNIQGNVTVQQQPQQSPTSQQPKIMTGTTVIRPQLQKTTSGISLINNSIIRGQTTLTAIQQKQILQNLVAQQQKQQLQQRAVGTGLNQNTIVIPSQQAQHMQTKNVIIQQSTGAGTIQQQQQTTQQQIQKIINVSGANIQTVSGQNIITTSQGQGVQQTNFTPQIIQIHQASSTGGPTKIQTINASMLQNFKQQHIRLQQTTGNSQQQSLIIKQQMLQQLQSQQQQQQQQQKSDTSPTTVSVSVGTGSPKTVTSIIGTNFITTNPTSLAPGTVIHTSPQNIIKHGNLQQQQLQGTQQNITKQFTVVSQPQNITRVVKTVGSATSVGGILQQQQPQIITTMAGVRTQTGNPVKVLTNTSGQIISLESLLQKQGVAPGTTLRVSTGNKPNQTNLIQLTGTPGSQITQYAVVSQGRNLISVSGTPQQQRFITTQATNSNIVTSLSNSGINVGNIKTTASVAGGSGSGTTVNLQNISGTNLGTTVQLQNTPKMISTNQLTAQQLMNAKVLGKAGTTGIRMVNASNLNIAHIRGKPVIIASKPGLTNQQQGGSGINVGGNTVGQNVQIIQNSAVNSSGNIVIGGQTLKVQGNVLQAGNVQVINQSSSANQPQTVMLGNQILKVAQSPIRQQQQTVTSNILSSNNNGNGNPLTTIASTNTGTVVVNSSGLNQNMPKTVVLGSTGQTIRVQSSGQIQNTASGQNQQIILGTTMKGTPIKTTGAGQQRVVLAVQGGGQILLPPGFQGGSINLKSIQGLKVVSLAQQQQQQNKGVGQKNEQHQNQRPMFAQLFTTKPSSATTTGTLPSSSQTNTSQNSTGGN